MAYQLSDISTKVGQRIRDSNYPSPEITDYLNDTLNDIYTKYRLSFMQSTESYLTSIGVSDITNGDGLPADFSQVIDVVVTTSGKQKVIPYFETTESDLLDPAQEDVAIHPVGDPQYWYFFGNEIKVFPAPATAYLIKLRYYRTPAVLADTTDEPDLPSQYEEALVLGASYRILQVKDNYDQAAVLENRYDRILRDLVVRSSQPQVGSPIVMKSNRRRVGKSSF